MKLEYNIKLMHTHQEEEHCLRERKGLGLREFTLTHIYVR